MSLLIAIVCLFELVEQDNARLSDALDQCIEPVAAPRSIDDDSWHVHLCCFHCESASHKRFAAALFAVEHDASAVGTGAEGVHDAINVFRRIAVNLVSEVERFDLLEEEVLELVLLDYVVACGQGVVEIKRSLVRRVENVTALQEISHIHFL